MPLTKLVIIPSQSKGSIFSKLRNWEWDNPSDVIHANTVSGAATESNT